MAEVTRLDYITGMVWRRKHPFIGVVHLGPDNTLDAEHIPVGVRAENTYIYLLQHSWFECALKPFGYRSHVDPVVTEMAEAILPGEGKISDLTRVYLSHVYHFAILCMRYYYAWEWPFLTVNVAPFLGVFSRFYARYNRIWRELHEKTPIDESYILTEEMLRAKNLFEHWAYNYAAYVEAMLRPFEDKPSRQEIINYARLAVESVEKGVIHEKPLEFVTRCFLNDVLWSTAFKEEYKYRPIAIFGNTLTNIKWANTVAEIMGKEKVEALMDEAIFALNRQILKAEELIIRLTDLEPEFKLLSRPTGFKIVMKAKHELR